MDTHRGSFYAEVWIILFVIVGAVLVYALCGLLHIYCKARRMKTKLDTLDQFLKSSKQDMEGEPEDTFSE